MGCFIPHSCWVISSEHCFMVYHTVFPQASQYNRGGAWHTSWNACANTTIQQCCLPKKHGDGMFCPREKGYNSPPPPSGGAPHRRRGGGAPPVRWSPPPWRAITPTPGLVWAQCTGCCPGVFAPQDLWCMQGLGGRHRALVGVQWAAMAALLGTTATAMAAHVGPYCRHGGGVCGPAL